MATGDGGGVRIGAVFWELGTKVAADFRPQLQAATAQLNQVNQVAKQAGVSVGVAQSAIVTMATRSAAATKQAGAAAETFGQRYGRAALAIASASTAITSSGSLSAGSLKQLLLGGAAVAGFFGPQGALISAIGLSLAAVTGLFSRGRDEMERMVAEGRKAVLTLRGQIEEERRAGDQPALLARVRKSERDALLDAKELLAVKKQIQTLDAKLLTGLNLRYFDESGRGVGEKMTAAEMKAARNELELAKARREELQKLIPLRLQEIQLATQAALAIESQRGDRLGVTGTTVTARSPEREAADAAKQMEDRLRDANQALDALRKAREDGGTAIAAITGAQIRAVQQLAEQMGDTVRVLDIEIAALTTRFREMGASDAQIETIVAPLKAARDAAEGLQGAVGRIEIGKDLREKLTTPVQQLNNEIDALRANLTAAGKTETEIANAVTAARIEKLTALFISQGKSLEEATRLAKEFAGASADIGGATNDLASSVTAVGQALISVAGALGVVDQNVQSIARGALNLGMGLASGNPLQMIAGVGDILSALTTGNAEARERHAAAMEVLAGIRKNTGDLLGKDITGNQLDRAQTAAGVALGTKGIDPAQFMAKVIAQLNTLGIGFAEIVAVAKQFGITLDSSRESWQDFKAVLDAVDLRAIKEGFTGMMNTAALARRIFGQQNPLSELVDTARILSRLSPEIAKIFEGLDLTKAADRAIALQRAREVFEKAMAGEAELGGLTLSEFLDSVGLVVDLIRAVIPGIDDAGSVFDDAAGKMSRFQKSMEAFTKGTDRRIAVEDIDDPLEQFRVKTGAFAAAFPGMKDFFDQFDFGSVDGVKAFGAALPDFIKGIEDGSIVIAGLAAEDIPAFIDALLGLESAGDAAENAVLSLADTFAQAFQDIDLDAIIFGEDAQDTLKKKVNNFFAGLPAPDGTGEFDLSTKEGRDAALAALQEQARLNPALKPIIAELIRSIRNLPEIVGDAVGDGISTGADALGAGGGGGGSTTQAGSLQQMTLYQGDRLITLGETQLLRLTEISGFVQRLVRSAFVPPPAIPAPASSVFAPTRGPGGDIVININIGRITPPDGVRDPVAWVNIFNAALADQMARERFFAGSGQAI